MRKWIAVLSLWIFIHLVVLSLARDGKYKFKFWPLDNSPVSVTEGNFLDGFKVFDYQPTLFEQYDLSEFVVYCGAPVVVLIFIYLIRHKPDK